MKKLTTEQKKLLDLVAENVYRDAPAGSNKDKLEDQLVDGPYFEDPKLEFLFEDEDDEELYDEAHEYVLQKAMELSK